LLFQGWSNPQWGPDNGDISVFAISSRTTLVLGQTGLTYGPWLKTMPLDGFASV